MGTSTHLYGGIKMATNHYFQAGKNLNNRNEQTLMEGMIIECIKIKGFDLYYLPRNTENLDDIMGEDPSSYFNRYYPIEMYLENIDGFGGDGELLSKFGIEIRETATFTVARRRWEECTRNDAGLQLPNRPAEGDLLYFPMTKSFFEIRRVEHANPFYQLGKLYVYRITCELYQYSHEAFFTGDEEVDSINNRNTDELQHLVNDEYGQAILNEAGGYIIRDDFILKTIEPISDNEELNKKAIGIINWSENNPFAEIDH